MTEWAVKRFWTAARAVPAGGGFGVELDGRPVRTPAKAVLALPTEALAAAIAEEWQAQEGTIRPDTMPHTRMANSAIDRVAPSMGEVAEIVAAYGDSDLLCYRADAPAGLVARQAESWDPLLDWAGEQFGARLETRTGVIHVAQPEDVLRPLRAAVEALDAFRLAALHELVSLSGSLVIGLAAARGQHDPDALWQASRVDEIWQEEQWGQDAEAADAAIRRRQAFGEAVAFYRLCGGNS